MPEGGFKWAEGGCCSPTKANSAAKTVADGVRGAGKQLQDLLNHEPQTAALSCPQLPPQPFPRDEVTWPRSSLIRPPSAQTAPGLSGSYSQQWSKQQPRREALPPPGSAAGCAPAPKQEETPSYDTQSLPCQMPAEAPQPATAPTTGSSLPADARPKATC